MGFNRLSAIDAFIGGYNPTAKPFKWGKREVKGAQLRKLSLSYAIKH
jgi:hypothetical protein